MNSVFAPKTLSSRPIFKYLKIGKKFGRKDPLTKEGELVALKIIRKHRLWETFLVEKFKFKWDEVHDIAEQLEHIDSPELVNRLDEYLGCPQFDPHGDPIPNKNGEIAIRHNKTLDQVNEGESVIVVGVKDHTSGFLKYIESISLTLGTEVKVMEMINYDHSFVVKLNNGSEKSLSLQVCKNLFVG